MIQITLNQPDQFLKIKETLTRMGIANSKTKTLYQSCHILHKQGKYFIAHFKELLALDGANIEISEEDKQRTEDIAQLLSTWNMCDVVEDNFEPAKRYFFRIITHKEKHEWKLVPKYTMNRGRISSKSEKHD